MPGRGSWLEFEVETKGYVSVRIDRKRKLPVTVLLKALGMGGPEEILGRFGDSWLDAGTRSRGTTPPRGRTRCWRSSGGSGPGSRSTWRTRRTSSTGYSSTPRGTTSPRLAATRSTRSSSSTWTRASRPSPSRTSRGSSSGSSRSPRRSPRKRSSAGPTTSASGTSSTSTSTSATAGSGPSVSWFRRRSGSACTGWSVSCASG